VHGFGFTGEDLFPYILTILFVTKHSFDYIQNGTDIQPICDPIASFFNRFIGSTIIALVKILLHESYRHKPKSPSL
jgi:hypothetical protein